jgi:DNA-binding HxlR family transcriptional regulator
MDSERQGNGVVCPSVENAFALLGRKWAGLIIHVLAGGPMHFCDLEKAIPSVSARMITERVKDLEASGIVQRTVFTGTPVRVTYRLSEKGRALIPVMKGIEAWARTWSAAPEPQAAPERQAAAAT